MLAKAALALSAASLLAAACAPATLPANIPVKTTGGLLTQVVDSTNDVGRSPAAAIGRDGQPEVAYLLVKATLKPGQIPPPIVPNSPQPPAVVVATFLSQQGYWSRTSATPQDYANLKGAAEGVAYSDGTPIPGVTDAMAVDPNGHRYVVYSSPFGLFYTTDAATPPNSPSVFAAPKQITPVPTLGASIAVTADGTPWIAYYDGDTVEVDADEKGLTFGVLASTS